MRVVTGNKYPRDRWIVVDDEVMDIEITYTTARAYDCKDSYSKSIFWNKGNK